MIGEKFWDSLARKQRLDSLIEEEWQLILNF
jgi:hypothetical protein